jgi:hypothetical protein
MLIMWEKQFRDFFFVVNSIFPKMACFLHWVRGSALTI